MGQNDGISKHYKIIIFFYAHGSEMITEWGKNIDVEIHGSWLTILSLEGL